jgi:pimeloyl-ACP methyl ester carboxylesterase
VRHLRIPIWREGRVALEHAALRRDPVLQGKGVPRGDGAPVLLVPGFLAGDPSLATMAGWLKRIGYRPCRARMRANVDCATRALDRLERSVEDLAARQGRRVTVVGQSRGGTLARGLAMRRPDLVERIVCLGSPLVDQFAVHPLVRAHVTAVGVFGTFGVPGLFGRGCTSGDCCAETRALAAAPFPADVGFVSVYSRTDGIVDWRSCLDPDAEHVEVEASHIGMAANAAVYRAIAHALAGRAAPLAAAA